MRSSRRSATAALGLLLALYTHDVAAHPYPKDDLHDYGYSYLMPRACAQYCGYNNAYCCEGGSVCYTSNGIAGCSATGGGGFGIYTTTWTETKTFTSTLTSAWPAPTHVSNGGPCVPQDPTWIACGKVCCGSWQVCAWEDQCLDKDPNGGGGGGGYPSITTPYSAPYRPTTGTGTFTTSATGTALPGGAGGGTATALSPGAIAGIVIGVLFGLGLLMLLCFCCIARGLWNAIFGKKKKKQSRERVEVTEEYVSRRGSRAPSTHSRRDHHSGWYASDRPSTVHREKKKESSGAKWLGIGAAAATLLALLNFKKDKKPPRKPRTTYTDSYYSYTGTSPSGSSFSTVTTERSLTPYSGSSSSGGRTGDSRRTRETRTTRVSRSSRRRP
jgi:hypothetical protein